MQNITILNTPNRTFWQADAERVIYTTPMSRRWFRDGIGTVYAWDYEERYFYLFVEGVRHPHWVALSRSHMEVVITQLGRPQ